MGEQVAPPILGETEAREITEQIRAGLESVRSLLHVMYVSKGYETLGYDSFNKWLEGEFDVHFSYLFRQTHAALLEERLDVPIGTHLESHLRPLIEILDGDEQIEAYYRVHNGRTATDYKVAAMETYIVNHAPDILKTRWQGGMLAAQAAYDIAKLINNDSQLPVPVRTLLSLTSEAELAKMLMLMSKKGGETWQEILYSRTIPAFPEPIPIDRATWANLRAWLDVSSAEHKARHVEDNRERYEARSALVNELIAIVKRFVEKQIGSETQAEIAWERLKQIVRQIDEVT